MYAPRRNRASSHHAPMITTLILCLNVLLASGGHVQANQGDENDITYFYADKNYSALPAMIQDWETNGYFEQRQSKWPLIGFLAGVFSESPDTAALIPRIDYEEATDTAISFALNLGGHDQLALEHAQRRELPENFIRIAQDASWDIHKLNIDSPGTLDLLWGASFATGNPEFSHNIIDLLIAVARGDQFDIRDVFMASDLLNHEKPGFIESLVEKYGKERFVDLLVASTGLWGLASNAQQHDFIFQALTSRLADAQEANDRYVLEYVAFRAVSSSTRQGDNDAVAVMLSGTRDLAPAMDAAEKGDVKAIVSHMRIEFGHDDEMAVLASVFRKTGEELSYTVKMINPLDEFMDFGPFMLGETGEPSIYADGFALPKDFRQEPGAYWVRAVFTVGTQELQLDNQFFLYRP